MTTRSILAAAALALVALAAGPATQPSAYPLKVDVMTGEALPAGDAMIVEKVDGREVHFANAQTEAAFKAGGEASHKKMDALIVEAQKGSYTYDMCPVSDEKLGEMGKPVMFVDRGTNRLIELCCKGCVAKAKKDPAASLEKIDAAEAKKS